MRRRRSSEKVGGRPLVFLSHREGTLRHQREEVPEICEDVLDQSLRQKKFQILCSHIYFFVFVTELKGSV